MFFLENAVQALTLLGDLIIKILLISLLYTAIRYIWISGTKKEKES